MRLERAGFGDIRVWSHPEPVPFSDRTALADFLQTVCLREHLATIEPELRRAFAERVAAAMPVPTLDYVRLNIVARASLDPAADHGGAVAAPRWRLAPD